MYIQHIRAAVDYPGFKNIESSQFSTRPGWHVFSGITNSSPDPSTNLAQWPSQWRRRPRNRLPPRVGGQRTRTEENTRRHEPCMQTTNQTSHRARFFGDLVVDLDVKASCGRYRAERADRLSRRLQARRGHATVKKPRGEAVGGGRYPQT